MLERRGGKSDAVDLSFPSLRGRGLWMRIHGGDV